MQEILQKVRKQPLRMAAAAVVSIGMLLMTFFMLGGVTKHILIGAVLSIGSGLLLLLPQFPNKISVPLFVGYFLFVPLKIFQRIELPIHDMSRLQDGAAALNVWLLLCIYFLLFLICQRTEIALTAGNVVILLLFLTEYFVFLFRGDILYPNDLQAAGTALTVIGHYEFRLSSEAAYSVLYFLFFCFLGSKIRVRGTKKQHLWACAAGVAGIAMFYIVTMKTDYMTQKDIIGHYWPTNENQEMNGTLLTFLIMEKENQLMVPENYSEEAALELLRQAGQEYDAQNADAVLKDAVKPDIIFIMSEAWSDLSVLGELQTSEPYMPFTDSMAENKNAVKGNLYVSVLGGMTANSEFEALTGDSMSLLPSALTPYNSLITHEMDSLPRTLKQLGYKTMAMHPNIGAWNRESVYADFGFDDFIDAGEFATEIEYIRGFISDETNFNEIIYRYEHRNKEKPFFLFNVTIQNHSAYYEGEMETDLEVQKVGNTDAAEIEDIEEAEVYCNLIKQSDKDMENLISYFEQQENPVIVCYFGDHQPILSEEFYSAILEGQEGAEEELNSRKYITPYVLWANYDAGLEEYGDFSANYLPTVLMQAAGLELPDYYKFLANLKEEYPVLSRSVCIDSTGKHYRSTEISGETQLKNYKTLQYHHLYDESF